jgi:sugar-specific transcriptional regulator TrmB
LPRHAPVDRNIKDTARLLRSFHLSGRETNVYLSLLINGCSKASQLAADLKIHRFDAYAALKRLQTRGMVEGTLTRPMIFTAVGFEKFLETERRNLEQDVTKQKAALSQLEKVAASLSQLMTEKSEQDNESDRIQILTGEDAILVKYRDLMQRTSSEILAIGTEHSVARWSLSGFLENIEHKKDEGVDVKLLFPIVPSTAEYLKGLSAVVRQPKRRMPARMVVFDGSQLILGFEKEESTSVHSSNAAAIWTNSRNLVEMFRILFFAAWESSPPSEGATDLIESSPPSAGSNIKGADDQSLKLAETGIPTEVPLVLISSK